MNQTKTDDTKTTGWRYTEVTVNQLRAAVAACGTNLCKDFEPYKSNSHVGLSFWP